MDHSCGSEAALHGHIFGDGQVHNQQIMDFKINSMIGAQAEKSACASGAIVRLERYAVA